MTLSAQQQAPIQGIAGNLSIEGEGTITIQVVSDEGKLVDIAMHAYYIPALGTRLFSQQGCMVDRKDSSQFVMERNQAMLLLDDPLTKDKIHEVTIQYDKKSRLPIMRTYRNALETANLLALKACLTDERNQNLTSAQKMLLRWHFKLGHTGFAAVQWLGRQGFFGPRGKAMGHARCDSPKCGTCLLGKQHKTANPAKHV